MFYPSRLLAFFAPRAGRMTQSAYIIGFVLPFVAVMGLGWLMFVGAPGLLGTPGYYAIAIGWTVLMATGDAHNIRRWQDLGSSGAMYRMMRPGVVLLPALAFALQFLVPAQLAAAGDMEALAFMIGMEFGGVWLQPAPLVLLAITFVGVTGNVIYLSIMPGQQGENAYGPDPRGDMIVPGAPAAASARSDGENDPVKRALADYHARRKAAARPVVSSVRPTGGATFGKKR
jgi:uncharacterized membrane protein YhaH (DUF805 family)